MSLAKFSRNSLGVLFLLGGINHFIIPAFYESIIPPYFPFKEITNVLVGILEIVAGVSVLFASEALKRYALLGILLLLIAFIPSHIYFIQLHPFETEPGMAVFAWFRLVVLHPVLIWWVVRVRKNTQ